MRHITGLLIALMLAFVSCQDKSVSTNNKAVQTPNEAVDRLHSSPDLKALSVLNVPPRRMRECLLSAYRLQPDKRFLRAVAIIHGFLSGEKTEAAVPKFSGNQWTILYKSVTVGTLPEFPDFPDFMRLLEDWVRSVSQKHPIRLDSTVSDQDKAEIEDHLFWFVVPYATTAVDLVDKLWNKGERDPALLIYASQALAQISMQTLDRLETADIVPAKALAILAITRVLTQDSMTREEVLLSKAMGYSRHAEALAESLELNNAVRQYIVRDDEGLLERSGGKDGSEEAKYLYLLRLAQEKRLNLMRQWLDKVYPDSELSLPLIKAQLDLKTFTSNATLSRLLPRLVMLSLAQDAGLLPSSDKLKNSPKEIMSSPEVLATILATAYIPDSTLYDNFETGLKALGSTCPGPFLDAELYQAYYQGYFFSALYIQGLHYLDSLSSSEAVKRFAATLGDSPKGIAADFQTFYRSLARSKTGRGDLASLERSLQSFNHLGAPPMMRILTEQLKYFQYGDPRVLRTAKYIVCRMDSRPTHRQRLLYLAGKHLLDLRMSEALCETLKEVAPYENQDVVVWHTGLIGKQDLLLKLLRSGSLKPASQVKVIQQLEDKEGIAKDFIKKEYQRLIAEDPDSWSIRNTYRKYLKKIGEYGTARLMLQDWLNHKVVTGGLERIFAQNAIAESYYEEGQYEKAWETIQPVVGSYQAWSMHLGARILDKLKRHKEAVSLAKAVIQRYPDGISGRILLAELNWNHGANVEAAIALKNTHQPLTLEEWQFKIGPKFFELFGERTKEETMAAFSELKKRGFEHFSLLRLTFPFHKAGKHEPAFEMASQLQDRGMIQVNILLNSYRYLKALKGKEQALNWLRPKIPSKFLNPASMMIYRQKEYDLLWDLIQEPEKGSHADFVWLMRAASSLKLGKDKDPHYEELIKHFENATDSRYTTISRFLLGLTDQETVLQLAKNARSRCEIAYYLGLHAQGNGRYKEASDWFRVSIETGQKTNGEYRWAYDTLRKWQSKGMTLERLAAKRL